LIAAHRFDNININKEKVARGFLYTILRGH
jgi:hypothetical protein